MHIWHFYLHPGVYWTVLIIPHTPKITNFCNITTYIAYLNLVLVTRGRGRELPVRFCVRVENCPKPCWILPAPNIPIRLLGERVRQLHTAHTHCITSVLRMPKPYVTIKKSQIFYLYYTCILYRIIVKKVKNYRSNPPNRWCARAKFKYDSARIVGLSSSSDMKSCRWAYSKASLYFPQSMYAWYKYPSNVNLSSRFLNAFRADFHLRTAACCLCWLYSRKPWSTCNKSTVHDHSRMVVRMLTLRLARRW